MLERLIIENVALINRLDLELDRGLTVLTGETGAGKSIIIDGLNLVLGSRGSRELISYGKQKCRAEGVFDVSEMPELNDLLRDMDLSSDDGELIISRELNANGKSLCRVNGVVLPLASLKQITDMLCDIHGQHEHQSLLDESNHLSVIDKYRAQEIDPIRIEVNSICSEYNAVNIRLNSGFLSEGERERRIDILKYQIGEIEKADLKEDEEDRIKEELTILMNSEKIADSVSSASSRLNGDNGAVTALKKAVDDLGRIADLSSQYGDVHSRLSDLYYEIEDAAYSVRDLTFDLEFDPRRVDELETRLDVIESLKHKYGKTVSEVLAFKEKAETELNGLTGDASVREMLSLKRAELVKSYDSAAEILTRAREASASELCSLAEEQLKSLGMKKAKLSADFEHYDGEPRSDGRDEVRLLLSANEGEPLKPLSKVASGGELSRIMLALKTVINDADGIPTLIFDEVDTGISGTTANTVGMRMKKIAGRHQVLCVTHLPQIAAFADSHFVVSKHEENGKTVTHVRKLSDEEKPFELARIMGVGSESQAAVEHAKELIEKASRESL
ncbi:MAG: DNA repair protein RecN [Clostridiales bacterium]|nr:DNA repair protein RecN [Clostridiales bacterium]